MVATIKNVGTRVRYSIEGFDGGLNKRFSPSRIEPNETPDCRNVIYDEDGAVATRDGSQIINLTNDIGSFNVQGATSYNNSMVLWSNGTMFRASFTTNSSAASVASQVTLADFTPVSGTTGTFTTANQVVAQQYQGVLFFSDGTKAWKYSGDNIYKMGIETPSATTGVSESSGSCIATGNYYYKVSFVNSQAVEGSVGSAACVTLASSALVALSEIPVGSSLAGVNARNIYRATSVDGDYRLVGTLSDNTTTTFVDDTPNEEEGRVALEFQDEPKPFSTITLHKDRLFMDDLSTDDTIVRWTNLTNPFVSEPNNFEPFDNRDGELITRVAKQDDVVTIFKENKAFGLAIVDPADSTTWQKIELPANMGTYAHRTVLELPNGLLFVSRQNGSVLGLSYLSGIQVVETDDGKLRARTISEKIEFDFQKEFLKNKLDQISLELFENRVYMAVESNQSANNIKDRVYWFDLNRLGSMGQPGSWSLWDGFNADSFFVHDGKLYCAQDGETGKILQLNSGRYADSNEPINSYFWTKQIGGADSGQLDSYIKDFREVYIWAAKLGDYNMSVRWRTDGDMGAGNSEEINLNPGGSLWGSMVWGVSPWGGTRDDFETRIPIGKLVGKRIQFRFDNQDKVDQAFKVYRLEVGMNLRRYR